MALVRAKLQNKSDQNATPIEVMFNPGEYSLDRGANYAEMAVPGLNMPILQFVRGESQTLSLELFLDLSDSRQPLEPKLDELRTFVKIDEKLHSPPVCEFAWGRLKFQGVVTSLKEKHTLFDPDGNVIRARVTLTLKSYQAVDVQLRNPSRQSPDRTHVRVFREGERLDQLAYEAYGDPRLWRPIADANGIKQLRSIPAGTPLVLPSLK